MKFYSKAVGPLDDMKIVIFNNLLVLFWYTITKTKSILVLGHNIWYTITKTNNKSIEIL